MPQSYLNIQGLNEVYNNKDKGILAKEIKMMTIENLVKPNEEYIKKIIKSNIDRIEKIMQNDQEDFTNAGFTITDKTKKLILRSIKTFNKFHKFLTAINIKELDKTHHSKMHFRIRTGHEFKTANDYYKFIFKEAILNNEMFTQAKSLLTVIDNQYIVAIFFIDETMTSSYPKILNVFVVSSENQYDVFAPTLFSQIEYNEFWFEPTE